MNQDNNIIGYDSQTGQPIYANQNINMQQPQSIQQPVQPQQAVNYQQVQNPIQNHTKSNKVFAIIAILVVVVITSIVLYFNNPVKKEKINDKMINNSQAENNNNQNNEQQSNNSTGSIEEGTNTTYDENGAFLFSIEDVFTISYRGTIVTGSVERGKATTGDVVQIIGLDKEILTTEITEIETFRKELSEIKIGDNAGLLLKDISREQVERGQVIAKPNSIAAIKKFDANVKLLSKEEGGSHTPFFDGHDFDFYFRTTNILGTIDLPSDIEMVSPGENVSFNVTLTSSIAMEVGTEFAIREDGKTVGKGTVTKVY